MDVTNVMTTSDAWTVRYSGAHSYYSWKRKLGGEKDRDGKKPHASAGLMSHKIAYSANGLFAAKSYNDLQS